jgi:hypothetical protein
MLYLGPDPSASPVLARERFRHVDIVGSAANADDCAGHPADTHWSRILCYDLEAANDGRQDETSRPLTDGDWPPGAARRGKRFAVRAIVVIATFVALYAAGGAYFRASTLPNAAAAVAPESAILPPRVSDFPVDARPSKRRPLAVAFIAPDVAGQCAAARFAFDCIFN